MSYCKECRTVGCNSRGKDEQTITACEDYTNRPRTNADRIRTMSDEELAWFISEIADTCETNTECNQHCYGCDEMYCERDNCLKWLQSEPKEASE